MSYHFRCNRCLRIGIISSGGGSCPDEVTHSISRMDGLKVAVEYSANWDYPVSVGGTGRVAHGWFGLIQLNF